jgi:hypothetical protein
MFCRLIICWKLLHLLVSLSLLFLKSLLVLFTSDLNRTLEWFWSNVKAVAIIERVTAEDNESVY